MAENRSRFVLLCQQSLAFGLVAAIAAPAAGVMTLDIVAPPHEQSPSAAPAGRVLGAAERRTTPSLVAAAPVRPTVSTVPLGGVTRAGLRVGGSSARLVSAETTGRRAAGLTVLSSPQPVAGLATVGVTWRRGAAVADGAITVSVRTRTGAAWSAWQRVPYHEEEGPDPSSTEGRDARPGTDPVYVGHVDDVQVKAVTATGDAPRGMSLTLVDPGRESTPQVQRPAIDTGDLALSAATTATTTDRAELAGTVTARPRIYSRAQWGADERMRERGALHYGEVHAGFVHHTVNANSYTRAQVPAIIRGIYAYHTQSRGWSDVGYNFLVDRFGRIWEGRYGGVDRPVVGAHTSGYNDDAFAMSAIGNFDVTRPSAAMVDAYGRLFAWKLSLHGVRAGSTRQWVTKRYLPAIEGHRDVGQTACPGRYLYARIPAIRTLAAHYQRSFAGRARLTNLVGIAKPDLVVRDRRTKQAFLVRSDSTGHLGRVTATGTYLRSADRVLSAGDWNGDGHGDVVTRSGRTGLLFLYRGTGTGRFRAPVQMNRKSFGVGAAAHRRRRLHRRRAAGPARPAARRLDAGLPRGRRHRLPGRLRGTQRAHRQPAARRGPVELRRVPGHDGPPRRRLAGALPGQRPGRAHRRQPRRQARHRRRLGGRRRRPDRRPPGRPGGPRRLHRPAVATGRDGRRLRPQPGLRHPRHASLRPRRLRSASGAGR